MKSSPTIAYYSSGHNGSLEQPLIFGLKSLGLNVMPWPDDKPSKAASQALYVFLARDHWDGAEKNRIQAFIDAQLPCFIASPCKHSTLENPCLIKTLQTFNHQIPIIYPPYDPQHLGPQLGITNVKNSSHINQVLLVEDSPSMLAVMEHYLTDLGYQCYATLSAKDALEKVSSGAFDILLTDYQMEELNGIELIEKSREVFDGIHTVLITSYGDKATILQAIGIHVDAFLEKPVEIGVLKNTLKRIENMVNMRRENRRLMVELTESNTYLKEGKEILDVTLESLNEAVLSLDSDLKIISANSATQQLTQHNVTSLLGASFVSLISKDVWSALYKKCKDSETGASMEGTITRVDNSTFPANITLRRSTKVLRGLYILVIQDISSQKKNENRLLLLNEELEVQVAQRTRSIKEAKDDAERANQIKSEFLANISHELRTPMHAIMSFNSLINTLFEKPEPYEKLKEQVEKFTFRISQSSKRLLKLINNLLDLSKLETEHATLQAHKLDILKTIEDVMCDISPLLQEKNIEVNIKSQSDNNQIYADNEKMTQVIFNLLSNACKFSQQDSAIQINIENSQVNVESRSSTPFLVDSLKVCISDQGIGIPNDEINNIFDKFIQSSKTKTGAGGTGLGLAICKEIINLHRGEIFAENNEHSENKGACFTFNIPSNPINWQDKSQRRGEQHDI